MAGQSASIGANFSQYQGNSNLGGGVDIGVLNIDTKPLEDLGKYTMLYNRQMRQETQKKKEEQVRQLADLTAYDLTTAISKDREIIEKEYNDLIDYVRANPTVLDYEKNPEEFREYAIKKNALNNTLKYGKTRSLMALTRQSDIEKEPNAQLKSFYQKKLDEDIAATDIKTPLRITEQFDYKPVEILDPGQVTWDQTNIDPNSNEIVEVTYKGKDVGKAARFADATALGLQNIRLDVTAPDFLKKSPKEQKRLVDQYTAQQAGGKLLVADQAAAFNAAFKQYGGDIEKIKSSNPLLANVIKTFEDTNRYVEDQRRRIETGIFKDKGASLQFGQKGLNAQDYRSINYLDGEIQPRDILFAQALAKAPSDSYDTKVTETGNSLQNTQQAETKRHNIAMEGLDRAALDQKKKEWQTNQDGSETLKNSAWKYAEDIIGQLNKVKDAGSAILPNKFGELNNEILMALGSERAAVPAVRDDKGTIIESAKPAGFYPLELAPGNVLRIVGDNVYLYDNVTTDQKTGQQIFGANPTKSTSLANIATNRLIRALKSSSGKEISLFTGVDADKAPISITDTKTKSSSGSSSSGSSKEIKRGDIPWKSAAAGYSQKEYETLLKNKGVKIIN